MTLYERPGDDIDRGLVGYWKLDDKKSGSGTAIDQANFNNGTITSATNTAGINGLNSDAMFFDGDDDVILIDDGADSSLDFGSNTNFTVCFWMKTAQAVTTSQALISHRYLADSNKRWRISQLTGSGNPASIWININDGTNNVTISSTNKIINDNNWNNIVVVFDRDSDITVYVNAEVHDTVDMSSIGDLSDLDTLNIGSDPFAGGAENFEGSMQNLRIYNRTLTLGEISKLYRLKK